MNIVVLEDTAAAAKASALALKKRITLIAASGKKLDAAIHGCAVACLVHAENFGDVRPFAALYAAMPKGSRRNDLVRWAAMFSPVFLTDDKGELRYGLLKEGIHKKYVPFSLEAASNTPFYDIKSELDEAKEQLQAIFDAAKANKSLASLLKKMEESQDERVVAVVPELRLIVNKLAA